MTAHYCPDCGLLEVSVRKPGKDGRCDWCRAQVGQRRIRSVIRRRDVADIDEIRTRLSSGATE